jgi:CTP:phosphocholine cytidylyltransferase-like protein
MKTQTIKTAEVKTVRRIVKKYGIIPVKNNRVDGVLRIVGYRKVEFNKYGYSQFDEHVDVVFKGKIYASMSGHTKWIEHSDILQNVKVISQMKLNRVLRRFFFEDVQFRAAFFSIRLFQPSDIKKVKWVC